jgi:hypothetical protein
MIETCILAACVPQNVRSMPDSMSTAKCVPLSVVAANLRATQPCGRDDL